MKKTIAILLILVIGMVGVFADPDTVIKLATTVAEYTRMAITTDTDSPEWGDLDIGAISAYATNAYGFTEDEEDAVHFHAESNNRFGVTIQMQAQSLTSTMTSGQSTIVTYLDYKVEIDEAESFTVDGENGEIDTVVALQYVLEDRKPHIYYAPVTITLIDDLDLAAAGTYTGQIAFYINAN